MLPRLDLRARGGHRAAERVRIQQAGVSIVASVSDGESEIVSFNLQHTFETPMTGPREGPALQQCPHSGCWAVIDDGTGQIRIDTQKGGFALPLKREGSQIHVVGKLEQTGL